MPKRKASLDLMCRYHNKANACKFNLSAKTCAQNAPWAARDPPGKTVQDVGEGQLEGGRWRLGNVTFELVESRSSESARTGQKTIGP